MHRKLINQARINVILEPRGPVLIKTGQAQTAGEEVEMAFVRTRHAVLGETVYLPGSSLKGILRSHCERIARTVGVHCCDPFRTEDEYKNKPDYFCGKRYENETDIPKRYRCACRICQLFGSTVFASRFAIPDAYPLACGDGQDPNRYLEKRTNVGIDRFKGSSSPRALFSLEVVTGGEFHTTIHMENFELWQLGLVGLALRDLGQELVPIGMGKARGLGRVQATVEWVELTYHGQRVAEDQQVMERLGDGQRFTLLDQGQTGVYGVGAFLSADERGCYGYRAEDQVTVPVAVTVESDWLSVCCRFPRDEGQPGISGAAEQLFERCVLDRWASLAGRPVQEGCDEPVKGG